MARPLRFMTGARVGKAAARGVAALGLRDLSNERLSAYEGYYGGAAIIDGRWAVTAAHCLDEVGGFDGSGFLDLRNARLTLRLTLQDDLPRDPAATIDERLVEVVFRHPRYNGRRAVNDIALLRLAESCTDVLQIAKMRPRNGAIVSVRGWGAVAFNDHVSDVLRAREVVIRRDSDCRAQRFASPNGVDFRGNPRTMICAGGWAKKGVKRSTGACSGDSGGPLIDEAGCLVGIASWTARNCGSSSGAPDVFVYVPAYRRWLEKTMA